MDTQLSECHASLCRLVLRVEGIEFALCREDLTVEYACGAFTAGASLFDILPELAGMEETIHNLQQTGEELHFLRLNRLMGDQVVYLDVRLLPLEKKLLVIFRDTSYYGNIEQGLIQQRNEIFLLNRQLEKSRDILERLSTLDELTQLPNRRAAQQFIAPKLQQVRSKKSVLSVLFIDLDNMKEINDHYGHQNGDLALQHLASTLRAHIRAEDIAIRWGGDEFVVLLSNAEREGAHRIAQSLLTILAQHPVTLTNHEQIHLTVSIGICSVSYHLLDKVTLQDIIHFADNAMYVSKKSGGGRITDFDLEDQIEQ